MRKTSYKMKARILLIGLILLFVVLAAVGVFSYRTISDLKVEAYKNTTALQEKINSSRRTGYVAVTDIETGAILTETMLVMSNDIASDVSQDLFISASDIGKQLTTDVKVGQPIFTNMVTDPMTENYHERECSFIWLSSNLTDNDFVDVRILFENGEDYVVAAKKPLKQVSLLANNCFLWLTEEEILSLDAAIVDANLHSAKIYTTKYVKPTLQEASIVNYEPNHDVIALMEKDPNIVTVSARELSIAARNAMEGRLQLFEKAYPDFNLDDTIVDEADKTPDAVLNAQEAQDANAQGVDTTTPVNENTAVDSTAEEEKEISYVE